MTMADPHDPLPPTVRLTLELVLHRADPDEGLTCWFCHREGCEWDTSFNLDGTTMTVGVHERCRKRLRLVEFGGRFPRRAP